MQAAKEKAPVDLLGFLWKKHFLPTPGARHGRRVGPTGHHVSPRFVSGDCRFKIRFLSGFLGFVFSDIVPSFQYLPGFVRETFSQSDQPPANRLSGSQAEVTDPVRSKHTPWKGQAAVVVDVRRVVSTKISQDGV